MYCSFCSHTVVSYITFPPFSLVIQTGIKNSKGPGGLKITYPYSDSWCQSRSSAAWRTPTWGSTAMPRGSTDLSPTRTPVPVPAQKVIINNYSSRFWIMSFLYLCICILALGHCNCTSSNGVIIIHSVLYTYNQLQLNLKVGSLWK